MNKILVAAAIFLLAACNVNYERTPSGLLYKINSSNANAPKLKVGQFAKIDMNLTIHKSGKDSVISSTTGRVPMYVPVDTGAKYKYSFMELLPQCSVGDEVQFVLSVDTLKKVGAIPNYSPAFAMGDMINCKMKILKVFNNESEIMADYQKESDAEKTREIKDLENYLSKKGIKAEQTKNGVFVKVDNAGDPATKIDSGKQASILYKGYFEDGKIFDTNMDTTKGHKGAATIVFGEHQTIPGFEEGLKYFGKGGKGTIFIPAMLGYGPQARGPEMPAYSNLIFNVEVGDVTNAPPPSAMQNPYSKLTPEQMQQLQQRMQQLRNQMQKPKDSLHH